ncbi:hypothetical protein SAMN06265349_1011068 [Flavobacterium resistens]|uniref:Uncharacterized protein n=1 Tax=Flavobacterium resistens TaxID=443612 RepID=A0A521BI55_9FLAO|nr:hypothetical protein [Flavobacterium resistens]MRX67383.1 hypothetical protein [Flavobacterium resistens]SMO46729.1 hypothetical protein SAMN06265349_1011068 [Flavobacterium resistens]
MNLKNHPFFKKYKYVKIILLVHFIFSLIVCVSMLVHGIKDKDILGTFEKAFDNHKAFNNPEKYLKKELFVIDTVFIDIETSSSQGKSTSRDITVIRGNLLHSTKKKELRFTGMNLNFFHDTNIVNENIKPIKVWRNTINDEVFLGNEREFERAKTNAVSHIYFYFSIIPLFIILLILKKKT